MVGVCVGKEVGVIVFSGGGDGVAARSWGAVCVADAVGVGAWPSGNAAVGAVVLHAATSTVNAARQAAGVLECAK